MFGKTIPIVRDVITKEIHDDILRILKDFCRNEESLKSEDIRLQDSVIFNLATINLKAIGVPTAKERFYTLLSPTPRQWTSERLDTVCMNIQMKYGEEVINNFERRFKTSLNKYHAIPITLIDELFLEKSSVWIIPMLQLAWRELH